MGNQDNLTKLRELENKVVALETEIKDLEGEISQLDKDLDQIEEEQKQNEEIVDVTMDFYNSIREILRERKIK